MRRSVPLIPLLFACACAVAGTQARNELANPGFERVAGGKVYGWSTPEYWSGATLPVSDQGAAHGGRRCAKLTSDLKRSTHWGRTLTSARPKLFVGARFRYSLWAKGKGEFLLGYIQYVPPEARKPHYKYYWQERTTPLTDAWQQVVHEFVLDDPRTVRIAPVAEVRGEGSVAFLDDAVAREVAAECGAGYLDVYEPTRRHPDKPTLFTADGVHLSNAGNRLIALEILKYLARE